MPREDPRDREQRTWTTYVAAKLTDKGHGGDGEGSPITRMAVERAGEQYRQASKELADLEGRRRAIGCLVIAIVGAVVVIAIICGKRNTVHSVLQHEAENA